MPVETSFKTEIQTKLREAQLSLNLMRHAEATQQSLIDGYSMDAQFAYLLRMFLGACFTALSHLKEHQLHACTAEIFRKSHSEFYLYDGGYWNEKISFAPLTRTYHFSRDIQQQSISNLCSDHLAALSKLIDGCFNRVLDG